MHEQIANLVYPVLRQGLQLKEQLQAEENLDLQKEQAAIKGILKFDRLGDEPTTDSTQFLGVRYPLVCWLDEIFILDSPWKAEWREHSLEVLFYGSAERSWNLYQARLAETQGDTEALEVFFLCVMLGFRGELRNAPEKLKAWREGVESQLAQGREEWTGPVALQPPTHVPVLQGAGRKQRMLMLAAVSLLVLIPLVVFYLVSRLQP